MTQLPDHIPSALQTAMAADAIALAGGEFSEPAVYKKQAQGDGVVVSIVITSSNDDPVSAPGRGVTPGQQSTRQKVEIFAAAAPNGTDAVGGVTADGAIINLARGDVLIVNGASVGRPGSEQTLLITSDPRIADTASWLAEAYL